MIVSLSIAIVVYQNDLEILSLTIKSLLESIDMAQQQNTLDNCQLWLLDNSCDNDYREKLAKHIEELGKNNVSIKYFDCEKNLGFAKAHNIAIKNTPFDYHLILNPDVIIDQEAILKAINYLQTEPDCSMISPNAHNDQRQRLFLLKRYPSLLVLLFRGFLPALGEKFMPQKMANYEMRDLNYQTIQSNIRIISGCFMLARSSILKKYLFNERYFLYFEDFDLSWRISAQHKMIYHPQVKIQHFGGNAARKGIKHILYFMRSGLTFFSNFGWKLF